MVLHRARAKAMLKEDWMAVRAESAGRRVAAQPVFAEEVRYMARQPILDARGRVHAYDLLFRERSEPMFQGDAEVAVETILDNELMFGLQRLTNGLPAFITCTAEALIGGWVLVLVPRTTVLGIPASLDPEPALLDACELLKARGFRLVLDDFGWTDKPHPLLHLADYIRVDFRRFRQPDRQQLLHRVQSSVMRVAQKVETAEDYQQASKMGFNLFQGNYFCNPMLLKKRKVPANSLLHLEIVRELYHDPLDIRKVSELVRRDASLTYRLLRLVNSPIYGIYREVRSVETAIMVLGESTFRRVVLLAVMSGINTEQSAAIVNTSIVRARFCELAARLCGLEAGEQYLLGMLSLLPAMLGVPMEEIVPILPLRGLICEALSGTMNPERRLLAWLECHEHGDWESCDRIVAAYGMNSQKLVQLYLEAVLWAAQPATA